MADPRPFASTPARASGQQPTRWLSPRAIVTGRELDPAAVARSFIAACLAVWALLTLLSLLRHYTFHSSLYDVGIFDQVLWNTAHGRPFESSIKRMSYLGDHFSPAFAVLAPLQWLPRSLDLIFVAHAGCVALTAWNVFQLARRHLDSRIAWLIGMGTLLSPQLYVPTLCDIHPEPFMAAALSRALLDLDRDRFGLAALWLLLVAGGKEDAGLLLGPFGMVLALDRRTRLFGIALALLALAWSALAMTVVMPLFRPPISANAPWFYLGRLSHLGSSPREILGTVLLHPLHAIWLSTTVRKLLTILSLLAPFAFAPLRSWRLLAVLPFAGAHYLSSRQAEFFFPFHYLVPIVPLLAWAAIDGAQRTIARVPRLTALLVLAAGVLSIAWRFDPEPLLPRANHRALADAIATIPGGESVCVENWLGAHLSERRAIDFCVLWELEREQYRYFGWPEASTARYQIFDLGEPRREHPALASRAADLRAAGARVIFDRDHVLVLEVDAAALARTPPVRTPPAPLAH